MNIIDNPDLDEYLNPEERRRIVPAFAYDKQIVEYFHGDQTHRGTVLPWSKTHANIRLRTNEFSVWAGVNGHGKSLLLNQVILGQLEQGKKACIASPEMTPLQTLARLTRQAVGVAQPSEEYIHKVSEWTDDNLWLYDQMNTVHPDTLLAVMRYCKAKLNVDHFVIDSLMKCGLKSDDYNEQKWFINELATIAKDTGLHIHLVAHSRKKENDHYVMNKFDIKGAGEITDMPDNIFTIWRNKKKEDESKKTNPDQNVMSKPDALMICDKQRHGEWEGKIPLWFDPASLQFRASEKDRKMCLFERNSDALGG